MLQVDEQLYHFNFYFPLLVFLPSRPLRPLR